MNEQDFKQWLREKTDTTPIPDQLSPEHITEQLNTTSNRSKWYKNPWINIAAAFILVVGISTSVWVIHSSHRKNTADAADNSYVENFSDTESAVSEKNDQTSLNNDFAQEKSNIQTIGNYHQLYDILQEIQISQTDSLSTGITDLQVQESISNDAVVGETSASPESQRELYYDTNAQVEGIAEADIVKTDGTYIYSCYQQSGYTTNAVAIAKTNNGTLKTCSVLTQENIASELNYNNSNDFCIEEMYIVSQTLILLCTTYDNNAYNTYILTYDVSDAGNPKFLTSLMQEGHYKSSRFTGGYLYTFSEKWASIPESYQEFDSYIPHTANQRLTCDNIYIPECPDSSCYQLITSMELEHSDHFADSKAILSGNGIYYISENNIYLAQQSWNNNTIATELLKFHYANGSIEPEGSITIAGHLLNQFSMDEYNGYLRVAATTESNALYIIDSSLNLVGSIENLAPDERIYSVRFMGDTGYFVTYRETDPLFSVDLSDPANPTVMDALKIPGFSNYLHFYSEDLLFGLGEEINPETGEFMGLKLSMFDISDPYNIMEVDKTVLPEAFYSSAQYDHKALMIDPERNLIGFHAECYNDYTYEYKEQYVIYSYSKGTGFQKQFTCNISENSTFSNNAETYDIDYGMIRGLYIGDYLYLVYGNRICSYSLDTYEPIDTLIVRGEHKRAD